MHNGKEGCKTKKIIKLSFQDGGGSENKTTPNNKDTF